MTFVRIQASVRGGLMHVAHRIARDPPQRESGLGQARPAISLDFGTTNSIQTYHLGDCSRYANILVKL